MVRIYLDDFLGEGRGDLLQEVSARFFVRFWLQLIHHLFCDLEQEPCDGRKIKVSSPSRTFVCDSQKQPKSVFDLQSTPWFSFMDFRTSISRQTDVWPEEHPKAM